MAKALTQEQLDTVETLLDRSMNEGLDTFTVPEVRLLARWFRDKGGARASFANVDIYSASKAKLVPILDPLVESQIGQPTKTNVTKLHGYSGPAAVAASGNTLRNCLEDHYDFFADLGLNDPNDPRELNNLERLGSKCLLEVSKTCKMALPTNASKASRPELGKKFLPQVAAAYGVAKEDIPALEFKTAGKNDLCTDKLAGNVNPPAARAKVPGASPSPRASPARTGAAMAAAAATTAALRKPATGPRPVMPVQARGRTPVQTPTPRSRSPSPFDEGDVNPPAEQELPVEAGDERFKEFYPTERLSPALIRNLETLPKEQAVSKMANLDYRDVLHICRTSRKLHELVCKGNELWKVRLQREYPYVDLTNQQGREQEIYQYIKYVQTYQAEIHMIPVDKFETTPEELSAKMLPAGKSIDSFAPEVRKRFDKKYNDFIANIVNKEVKNIPDLRRGDVIFLESFGFERDDLKFIWNGKDKAVQVLPDGSVPPEFQVLPEFPILHWSEALKNPIVHFRDIGKYAAEIEDKKVSSWADGSFTTSEFTFNGIPISIVPENRESTREEFDALLERAIASGEFYHTYDDGQTVRPGYAWRTLVI